MLKKNTKSAADELVAEFKREKSPVIRLWRKLLFTLGFSQCRYCVYCEVDGSSYRGMRESALLDNGKCKWSQSSSSSILSYDDLRAIHRCPAFTQILYNFKDYAIHPDEVENIFAKRKEVFFAWMGWIVAIVIAVISFSCA